MKLFSNIAIKFNNDFETDFFPVVEPLIFGEATRVMSLRDGTKKMSKSDPSEYSRINLTDGADDIAGKIRKAKTDPEELPGPDSLAEDGLHVEGEAEKARPEAFNLLSIYAALSGQSMAVTLDQFAGAQFSAFKGELVDLSVAKLGPIGEEMQRLMAAPDHVDAGLRDGAGRAAAIAAPVIKEVHEIVGFLGS